MTGKLGTKRITLADIGKKCGYHGTTVGLALKNHPRIPVKTRDKIQSVAREMGYQPDPSLSALVAYRRGKVNFRFNSKIAIVTDTPPPFTELKKPGYGMALLSGIEERAKELGYETELFSVMLDRSREKQVDRVLKARGINAVIIFGLERTGVPIHLSWDNYSLISIGYSNPNPRISKVTTKNRWGSIKVVEELFARGYRRPALVIPKEYDLRVDRGWSAGYLSACFELGLPFENSLFLPERRENCTNHNFFNFLSDYKPDVIITTGHHLYHILLKNGFRVPEDIGFICLDVKENDPVFSGICQNPREVGKQAVTLLSNLQVNNSRGLSPYEFIHLVTGTWMEGSSIRSRPS